MPPRTDDESPKTDRQTWVLIAAIVIAFGVFPLTIYYRPPQLPFLITYLILPLIPAFLLALLAVYVTATK